MPIVTLEPVTALNRAAILALRVSAAQQAYIAPNEKTLTQAAEHQEGWLRAIYVDDQPVGLLLLHDEHLRAEVRETGYYFLWRLMIDRAHQRQGIARQALDLLLEHLRSRPQARRLLSSFKPGKDGPARFYEAYGFQPTGELVEGEVEIALPIA